MDRDVVHVVDIVQSARLICTYIDGVARESFLRDVQLQDSVIRRIEVIGEAAGRISAPFRERHDTIPWREMIGMRNRMIHGYDVIDLQIVWMAAHERVPELLTRIERLGLPDLDGPAEHR